MTRDEFYSDLSDRLTVGCQLPFDIPEKALDAIVKYSKKWFIRNWDDATESVYLVLPRESWSTSEEFKKSRGIILPPCVYSVNAVAKDRKSQRMHKGVGDLSLTSFLTSTWGIGGGGYYDTGNAMSSDAVLSYVVASSWGDLMDHVFNYPISYEYNRQTQRLFLKGSLEELPDFVLDCDISIPDEALYDLDLFFDYCLGKARMDLATIIGSFDGPLPGGFTINYDKFYDQGKEEVDEVKEEVKSMSGGSSFFLTTGGL